MLCEEAVDGDKAVDKSAEGAFLEVYIIFLGIDELIESGGCVEANDPEPETSKVANIDFQDTLPFICKMNPAN